jgi:hypothetical protein
MKVALDPPIEAYRPPDLMKMLRKISRSENIIRIFNPVLSDVDWQLVLIGPLQRLEESFGIVPEETRRTFLKLVGNGAFLK